MKTATRRANLAQHHSTQEEDEEEDEDDKIKIK